MEGNWVSGSPIKKCPGDRYIGLNGSLYMAHKGLEFKQDSISVSRVQSSS